MDFVNDVQMHFFQRQIRLNELIALATDLLDVECVPRSAVALDLNYYTMFLCLQCCISPQLLSTKRDTQQTDQWKTQSITSWLKHCKVKVWRLYLNFL